MPLSGDDFYGKDVVPKKKLSVLSEMEEFPTHNDFINTKVSSALQDSARHARPGSHAGSLSLKTRMFNRESRVERGGGGDYSEMKQPLSESKWLS